MIKKTLTPIIILILGYGFWLSSDFKEIAFGVALFLFGMLALEDGFRSFTGGVLEIILKKTTDRTWKAISFGFGATTLMQSSGLVSVITISFLSAGLLGLAEGMGIVLGGNIGTTTGGWIMAAVGLKTNIAALAMPILVFGVVLIFQRDKNLKGLGYILAGLGFFFLGMYHIKGGFEAFKDKVDLARYSVSGFKGLLQFTLIGALATILLQSSHAAIVVTITAVSTGQVSYDNAVALVIGANVGTTSTAAFGAIGANEVGKRLAAAHVLFNLITAAIVFAGVREVVWFVERLSRLFSIAPSDYAMKIALFHTVFNVIGVMLFTPFIGVFADYLVRWIRAPKKVVAQPRYLNPASVDFPDTAVEAVRKELVGIYEDVLNILSRTIGFTPKEIFSDENLEELAKAKKELKEFPIEEAYRNQVKEIFSAVIAFISRATFSWHESQSQRLFWMRNAGRHLMESVKAAKHLQKNLVHNFAAQNRDQRRAYLEIRVEIARMIRELEHLRKSEEPEVLVVLLDHIKLGVAEIDHNLLDKIYAMINDGLITPEMGTSLINDYGYVSEIINNLVDAAGTLFADAGHALHSAQRSVSLDRGEFKAVVAENELDAERAAEGKTDENEKAP